MKFSVTQQKSRWLSISLALILVGLIAMFISWQQFGAPLKPGLDFTGGTRLQFELDCTQPGNCTKPIDLAQVRSALAELDLASSSIQLLGEEKQAVSIRTSPLNVEQRTQLQTLLNQKIGTFAAQETQIDIVGPTLGRELFNSGLLALLVAFAGIGVYLSLRFRSDYAVFAIIALFHDIVMTLGVFSILGLVLGTEVDSLFVVALLTIAGFSVSDTVVIYDRIRENINLHPSKPIDQLVDESVQQSLTRSLNTVFIVLLTLFSMFVFGGETLKNFSLALIIGFTMGAYSSIFIASPLFAWWRGRAEKGSPYQGVRVR
jgi:preprotein translocase subunit SecF